MIFFLNPLSQSYESAGICLFSLMFFSPLFIIKKGEEKVLAAIMHPLDNTIRTEPHTKLNSLKIR